MHVWPQFMLSTLTQIANAFRGRLGINTMDVMERALIVLMKTKFQHPFFGMRERKSKKQVLKHGLR